MLQFLIDKRDSFVLKYSDLVCIKAKGINMPIKNSESASPFSKRIQRLFAKKGLQIPSVFFYEETDSTNTRAKLFAENLGSGTNIPAIFFSRAQSAGRGTRERKFESPSGAGVYISFLIYPNTEAKFSLSLTTYAGCCVVRTLKKISKKINPKIKWVNDVTVDDRKLCGILTEGKIEDGKTKYAIVGIGINVKDAEHSPEVLAIMTSLDKLGVKIGADKLALLLSEEFFSGLSDIGTDKIYEEYKSASSVIGREVEITSPSGRTYETVLDIDKDFSLLTKDFLGDIHRYISADVSVKTKLN